MPDDACFVQDLNDECNNQWNTWYEYCAYEYFNDDMCYQVDNRVLVEAYGYSEPDVPDEACWSEESEGNKACVAQW